jgi:hypothetical protein
VTDEAAAPVVADQQTATLAKRNPDHLPPPALNGKDAGLGRAGKSRPKSLFPAHFQPTQLVRRAILNKFLRRMKLRLAEQHREKGAMTTGLGGLLSLV